MNVGIGFVTGRRGFKNLLKTYVNNWNEHGLIEDQSVNIRLFIAYDLKYFNTSISDYKNISPDLLARINGIDYYGVTRINQESSLLIKEGVLSKYEADLIFGEGYGKKRNAVLYAAVRNKMDVLLFIDDDEYPLAVFQNENLFWSGQGVVSTHLRSIKSADITHGRHCGYISPIPHIEFDDTLNEETFKSFISALSNDIINWDSIRNIMVNNKGATYADIDVLKDQPVYEVPEEGGMKFISGANLCFNLENISRIAPFYNPPGARGEDTFLSTCLKENKVLKVPCYTFHDGFLLYQNILNGVLPISLSPITANVPSVVHRFVNAARGWVRYKPLLTYITKNSEYKDTMKNIKESLDRSIPALCSYFHNSDFKKIFNDFKVYEKNVNLHHDAFEDTKLAWAKAIAWARQNTYT